MSAWKQAYDLAIAQGVSDQEWKDRIGQCLDDGYVFSTPTHFLAVQNAEHLGEPAYFVLSAFGGDGGNVLARFMRYIQTPKPWVLWCRNNERRIRAFRWDKLAKKAGI
jgi:hypothetical protein